MKLAREIGAGKAAKELGIPTDTLYGRMRAAREGRLDLGAGTHTPDPAMRLAEELAVLRKQVKVQEKEIRRLKEENAFLEEASAFSPPAVGSQQGPENEVPCRKDVRRRGKREACNVLPSSGSKPTKVLSVSCPAKPSLEVPGPGGCHSGDPRRGCIQ